MKKDTDLIKCISREGKILWLRPNIVSNVALMTSRGIRRFDDIGVSMDKFEKKLEPEKPLDEPQVQSPEIPVLQDEPKPKKKPGRPKKETSKKKK